MSDKDPHLYPLFSPIFKHRGRLVVAIQWQVKQMATDLQELSNGQGMGTNRSVQNIKAMIVNGNIMWNPWNVGKLNA